MKLRTCLQKVAFDEGIAENSDSEDIVNSGADFEYTAKTAFMTKRNNDRL